MRIFQYAEMSLFYAPNWELLFDSRLGVVLRSFFLLTIADQSGNFLALIQPDLIQNASVSFSSRCWFHCWHCFSLKRLYFTAFRLFSIAAHGLWQLRLSWLLAFSWQLASCLLASDWLQQKEGSSKWWLLLKWREIQTSEVWTAS